jgi:hypothetical protein
VTDAPFTSTPNPFTASEGGTVSHQFLGTFVDTAGLLYCDTADYSLSVKWGDNTAADLNASFVPSTHIGGACAFDVYGSHTFKEEGGYGTQVTATDKGGSTITWSDTVQVTDAPLTGISNLASQNCWVLTTCGQPTVNPAASVGGLTNVQTLGPIAKFQDGNTQYCNQEGDSGQQFTATVTWGDGSTSAGTVQEEGTSCTFDVLGSHTYPSVGTFTVSATIKDEGTQALTTTTAAETTSSIVVGVPPSTAPVARTGAKAAITYKSGTTYLMSLTATHFANGIFGGTLSVTDTPSGLSLSKCMVTTAASAACKMTLLTYSATSSKAVTIFGSYQQGAKGVVRYFRLDLHDAAPSVADKFTFLTTDATGHTIVTSTPPTAPNSAVSVVL